jgi:putative ABC transport system substrate-binding protein
MIKRRTFIAGLGSAAAWPVVTRAQRGDRVRRIGVLSQFPETLARENMTILVKRMQELGWIEGRNVSYDLRWGAGNTVANRQKYASELIALAPDVIVASSAVGVEELQLQTRTIPIVFAGVIDPVGGGLAESLARPGGNTTGFLTIEYGIGAKWLEILKQIAPGVTRVAVLRALTIPGSGQFGAIQSAAPTFGVEVRPVYSTEAAELERAATAFAHPPNGGVIVTIAGHPTTSIPDQTVIAIAARHRLPAVYFDRRYVAGGGLISYGSVISDQHRQAAGYVDRILKGEKPADLPVQAPTKFELVINLKTAKALGLTIPETLLATADEVIQ